MADSDDDDFLGGLFDNNRAWAKQIEKNNPGFFDKLAKQQLPRVLWIGCSDSRVPANEIIGMLPGDVTIGLRVRVRENQDGSPPLFESDPENNA